MCVCLCVYVSVYVWPLRAVFCVCVPWVWLVLFLCFSVCVFLGNFDNFIWNSKIHSSAYTHTHTAHHTIHILDKEQMAFFSKSTSRITTSFHSHIMYVYKYYIVCGACYFNWFFFSLTFMLSLYVGVVAFFVALYFTVVAFATFSSQSVWTSGGAKYICIYAYTQGTRLNKYEHTKHYMFQKMRVSSI